MGEIWSAGAKMFLRVRIENCINENLPQRFCPRMQFYSKYEPLKICCGPILFLV